MFIWNPEDINEEQEEAILETANVLLVACPGSGKTRTLTYKLAKELSNLKSNKQFIVAITYTHRAADEIKERVENLGVNTSQLWIGTIHAFCLEWILKPYYIYLDSLKMGFRVINSQESEDILTLLCADYNTYPKITSYDCAYIITAEGYRLSCNDSRKQSRVDEILKKYWRKLIAENQIDFQLILSSSYKLLNEKAFIESHLGNIFSYILLDEYQDTSEIQYLILSKIIKAGNNKLKMFVVGDPNQSIYTNLGGYAIDKSKLEILTNSVFKSYGLSGNYRSSNLIVNYFDYFKTHENPIIACGTNKDFQSTISFNNLILRPNLEDEIVRLILFNVNTEGIKPNEICIVAPQWIHLASLTRNLMIKLPDYTFDGPGGAPFARDIDNFFFKLCRIVLTEPSPNMYVRRMRWSGEILRDLEFQNIDISKLNNKRFLKICNSIDIQEDEGIEYLKKFIELLFRKINVDISSYISLNEHYNSFFKSCEDRITRLKKDGFGYISTTENFKKVFKQKDGITISTIHGVKGAEFDCVIAFALLEDYVPHFADDSKHDSAKKLLYVISSRARKNLHLISERGRLKNYGTPRPEYLPTEVLSLYKYGYNEI